VIGLAALAVLAASFVLCAAARWYALHAQVMDHPTTRSSHVQPTPRGGGIGFVVAYMGAVLALYGAGLLAFDLMLALVGAGTAVSAIGFVDDHRHVAARYRFLVHVIAAVWLTFWLGLPLPSQAFGAPISWPDWVSVVLVVLYVLWIVNLYNFMDGIDGLASLEAVTVGLGAALLAYLASPTEGLWIPPLFLAAAVAGFLAFNLPPARIFMGDVGSGFLGVSLAALAVDWLSRAPLLFWSATILLGAFVVDATVTLLRRMARGERVYDAHRSHAYQHAARRFGHKAVTYAVGLVNVVWLLPIAWLVSSSRVPVTVGLIAAYAPLAAAAAYFEAGRQREAPGK
jgi:Fuc2NAc and GlcNAc transferase